MAGYTLIIEYLYLFLFIYSLHIYYIFSTCYVRITSQVFFFFFLSNLLLPQINVALVSNILSTPNFCTVMWRKISFSFLQWKKTIIYYLNCKITMIIFVLLLMILMAKTWGCLIFMKTMPQIQMIFLSFLWCSWIWCSHITRV